MYGTSLQEQTLQTPEKECNFTAGQRAPSYGTADE